MENIMQESRTYFAASNSFDGFKSNFDGVFSPLKLKKLFILKGGPGTGKSTLMREVAKNFDGVLTVTNILCSSDTASLDGVLLERDGTIVAIADGTAPHVIEPRFPGAVEEIGESAFSNNKLTKVILPNSIVTIHSVASAIIFDDNPDLTEIIIKRDASEPLLHPYYWPHGVTITYNPNYTE